jgi:hypothetical protein
MKITKTNNIKPTKTKKKQKNTGNSQTTNILYNHPTVEKNTNKIAKMYIKQFWRTQILKQLDIIPRKSVKEEAPPLNLYKTNQSYRTTSKTISNQLTCQQQLDKHLINHNPQAIRQDYKQPNHNNNNLFPTTYLGNKTKPTKPLNRKLITRTTKKSYKYKTKNNQTNKTKTKVQTKSQKQIKTTITKSQSYLIKEKTNSDLQFYFKTANNNPNNKQPNQPIRTKLFTQTKKQPKIIIQHFQKLKNLYLEVGKLIKIKKK